MGIKLNPNSRGIIKTPLGEYKRAIENSKHIFYVNYVESDENSQVMMFDRKRRLVSDNNFAYEELMRVIEADEVSWVSPEFEKNWKKVCESE